MTSRDSGGSRGPSRRSCFAGLAILGFSLAGNAPSIASEQAVWAALRAGGIVMFRHSNAPGVGDPVGMRLDDCATQRNLDSAGQAQARRIGAAFGVEGVQIGQVLTSRWCRARDTADLAFPGRRSDAPAFDSFFDDRASSPAQTAAAKAILAAWQGPGALVVVSHQVNITALTGVFPASGEGVVIRLDGADVRVIGRIRP